MTKALADILANKWEEPPEIKMIKDYIKREFNSSVGVELRPEQIVIAVPSAAMASALRMHLHKIKTLLGTDKRLVIKIG